MDRAELSALVAATGCAVERGGHVFLCDPHWGGAERAQAESVWALGEAVGPTDAADGWLCIPTGGSSGRIKFARHDERTLMAAEQGFCAHFGLTRVNAVDVLPAHHVSGLMARVRCAESCGRHLPWDWKRLAAGEYPMLGGGEWVLSLVPTQLQRLLGSVAARDWLRQFAIIFLGGGPVWPALADEAAAAGLRVSLSYGMTETAAMVTASRPEAFLAGDRSSGAPLPHARVTLTSDGAIAIEGESVYRGYFPERSTSRSFEPQDGGWFDAAGQLHVTGRRDALIITGGEKVNPLEVEAALRASDAFADVAVIGQPDGEWGQIVVACYPTNGSPLDTKVVEPYLASLAPFKRPKRYLALADWPRNAQGKLDRSRLLAQLAADRNGAGDRDGAIV